MKRGKVKVLPNGDAHIGLGFVPMSIVTPFTRRIRSADGTWRTLISYDGSTWAMDGHREKVRQNRSATLHRGKVRAIRAIHGATSTVRDVQPALLTLGVDHYPDTPKSGNGKAKRPRPPKPEPDVVRLRPVHHHWCHGLKFVCSCDTPYFRRPCGGDAGCLIH